MEKRFLQVLDRSYRDNADTILVDVSAINNIKMKKNNDGYYSVHVSNIWVSVDETDLSKILAALGISY